MASRSDLVQSRDFAQGSLAAHVRSLRSRRQYEPNKQAEDCASAVTRRRLHKNAPVERGAGERLVRRKAREVVSQNATKPLDPRFDPLCGRLDENVFHQRYGFLRELRQKALSETRLKVAALERRLKSAPSAEKEALVALRRELQSEIDRLENQVRRDETSDRARVLMQNHKRLEKEQLAAGRKQRPYFLKRSVVREHLQNQSLQDLQKQRGWKRYLERKEQAATARERKLLHYPSRLGSTNRQPIRGHIASETSKNSKKKIPSSSSHKE